MPPRTLHKVGEFWLERKGGCSGLSPGSVRETSILTKSRWEGKNQPAGNVQMAYRERKPHFQFPRLFPDMAGGSLEIRLLVAQRLAQLKEAGVGPRPEDLLRVGVLPAKSGGFWVRAEFTDWLSDQRLADYDEKTIEVPLTAEISTIIMQPVAYGKKWNGERASWCLLEQGLKQTAEDFERPHRQLLLRQYEDRVGKGERLGSQLEVHLNKLKREEAIFRAGEEATEARWAELSADFQRAAQQKRAVKELGMVMPPMPEGWDQMIEECDETQLLTQRMAERLRKVGRYDTLKPYRFVWDGIDRHWLVGGLFGIIFNHEGGLFESDVFPSYATPIRARIAPEKALAEWQAAKDYRQEWREVEMMEDRVPMQELTTETLHEVLGGFKRKPLNFTGVSLE